jgi:TonB-linked SusC/RagA family outer membrane protein
MELTTGEGSQSNDSSNSSWSLFSVFGRVNYSFDNKYLLEAVVRRDGSSRFGANNKYGTFPAFSLAWRLSEENFMESTRGWLSSLKLRGGWGVTGNDRIDNYNSYSTFNVNTGNTGSFYSFNGQNGTLGTMGFRENVKGNEATQWETTRTTNVGIDVTLWRNLDITFDVWQRRTTDMLYRKQLPSVLGQATYPWSNVAEMLNRGFDFDITYRNTALGGELRYSINANISRYKNEIVRLSGVAGEFLDGDARREMRYTRAETGTAFPEFYGFIVDGIFQTKEEAAAHPLYNDEEGSNKPGRYKFRDLNNDGVINAADRTYIGSPHPDFTGGLRINLEYKNFDLNAEFFGSYGAKLVNYVSRWIDFNQFNGGRSHNRLYHSWGSKYLNGDNSKALLPMAEGDDVQSQQPSTAFLEDASYLRMRNLMIGYNFSNLLNMPSNQSLRLYVQATNLFTITKYPGLDPEVNASGVNMGVDMGAWPTPRQFMVGVTLGF